MTPFDPVRFDAGVLCPFPVTLEGSDGQLARTTLPDGTVDANQDFNFETLRATQATSASS